VNERTHLDLFSGIGGFALAAKWNGFRTVAFCDCEPYAQAVLKKHWPDVHVHGDIREVRGELYAKVTLLTGGFPCQPFSVAGKQRGKTDDRYLWPEMLRVIREARPAWIVGENVAGIVNMALDQVHADLEAEGYEVESLIIPASAVDAPHRRDRVWIVAHSSRKQLEKCLNLGGKEGTHSKPTGSDQSVPASKNVAHSISLSEGSAYRNQKRERVAGREDEDISQRNEVGSNSSDSRENVADTVSERGCSWNSEREYAEDAGQSSRDSRDNSRGVATWLAEPNVGRVAHGIPNRTHRLKGLGNAIVPQVAAEIIRCIVEVSK
jgi:DNA (cytosine-5)-methyltransferase 1